MIRFDQICPVPFAGGNKVDPFFVLEFSVEEEGRSPAKVADDLRRYYEEEAGAFACAFVFEFDDPSPPPWEQPAARAWATTFVENHGDLLGRLVDESVLMVAGFPIGDFPFVGRVRMLALAGMAKFVPRPASKCADETVDLQLTEEGEAFLTALRGQATSA